MKENILEVLLKVRICIAMFLSVGPTHSVSTIPSEQLGSLLKWKSDEMIEEALQDGNWPRFVRII